VGFGGLADYGNLRKTMFIGANTVASICCLLVMFGDTEEMFWFNGLMMMIANVMFGFSVVFYNAYLPLLTAAHPEVTKIAESATDDQEIIDAVNLVSSRISTRGFATGFCGQLIFLIINFGILTFMPDGGFAVRLNVFLCGIWTLTFGGYCFFNLKTRPGPPLPAGENIMSVSVKQVVKTFKSCKDLPQLFLFLGAYFIFSDGCSTLAGSAALFAAIELKMASDKIMLGILLVSVSAIASCFIWFNVEKKLGVKPKCVTARAPRAKRAQKRAGSRRENNIQGWAPNPSAGRQPQAPTATIRPRPPNPNHAGRKR
jgi:UMF1 family MFS transporter